jgi:hypothetical protein
MADRLQITDLDFDTIKTNLKTFLSQQSEFQDYDFEGSGLSILLDVLAYNTHYNAYYLNMVANEAFMDTALLRDSVVSHAKTLGYIPYSRTPAVANVNIQVIVNTNDAVQSLSIPKGFSFQSNLIDNKSYAFNIIDPITVSRTGDSFYFDNVDLHEGVLISFSSTYDATTNPYSIFTIPDTNVDTTSLKVTVQPSAGNSAIQTYSLASDILDIDATSAVYFLQEGRNQQYQIYFGDGIIGKSISDGSIVNIEYLITNGSEADKANAFIPLTDISGYANIITTINSVASGSSERESVDSIKYSAPLQFATQNRLVTYKDYESYIKKNYPSVDSVSVWGSEDDIPPSYGKVILSLKPKENYYISELEKQRIIDEIIKPKSIIAIQTEIRDPEYLYLLVNNYVKYDKRKTTDTEQQIKNKIRDAILNYRELNLNRFGGRFVLSKLQDAVDSTNTTAIIGSETVVRVQKRFEPEIGVLRNYKLNFNVPLHRGTLTNRLTSTEFDVFDSQGVLRTVTYEESAETYTGVEEIQVVNPGINYTSAPTVTITGDGTGATATATIVNQRVERITITNSGFGYTRAVVTLSGGGGSSATAVAIVTARTGFLRTVYYDADAQKQIVSESAGRINYETGEITLSDVDIQTIYSSDSFMRVTIESDKGIVETNRNTILEIDVNDSSSITVDLSEISAK